MKYVWYVQDHNSMAVDKVYTTKSAAFERAQSVYGARGIFEKITQHSFYYKPQPKYSDPYCAVERVPVVHSLKKKQIIQID
jgi:uncharacterized protein (DUF169 family)